MAKKVKMVPFTPKEVDINTFLRKERSKVISYLERNFSLSGPEDADDIFQNSSIAFFKNIKEGKLVTLTSTLSTYFLQICINQAKKTYHRNKKVVNFDPDKDIKQENEFDDAKITELLQFGEDNITDEQKNMMRDLVQNLPKPCDDILWYYYGDNLDMQTIADLLEYKNSTTVKSTKHRCMSKLKEKFDLIKNDFYEK